MSIQTKKEKELAALRERNKDVLGDQSLMSDLDYERKKALFDQEAMAIEEKASERLRKPNPALLKEMLKKVNGLRSK
jgi:hypothetical protein